MDFYIIHGLILCLLLLSKKGQIILMCYKYLIKNDWSLRLTVAALEVGEDVAASALGGCGLDVLQTLPALAHLPVGAGAVEDDLHTVQGHGHMRTEGYFMYHTWGS